MTAPRRSRAAGPPRARSEGTARPFSGEGFPIGGRRAVAEAIRAGRARRVLLAAGSRATEGFRAVVEEATRAGVAVVQVDRSDLDELGVQDHQGVAALVVLPRELDEHDLTTRPFGHDAVVVVLDGITDPQNLGASARCAEAAGVEMLVARRRRSAPVSPAAIRASAGALLHLPLARIPNLPRGLEHLKDRGFTVVGLDQGASATIHDRPPEPPLALVVGSEGSGLSRLVRESCDLLVSIPMSGQAASLNASAALAVGLFAYARRPAETAVTATMPNDAGVAQSGSASDL